MKFLTQLMLVSVLLVSVTESTLAEESQAVVQSQEAAKPMPGMGQKHKMGMSGQGMSDEQRDQHLRAKQEHLLKMHELSTQILAETDPAKQEALKVQQRQLMKEHYAQMRQAHKM